MNIETFGMKNVKDFGALGDGVHNDTQAIQAALDAGGIVRFPAGTYITGTLELNSNGGIYLDLGATIRASRDKRDYNADDFCPQNAVFVSEHVSGAHLIVAIEKENIFIGGMGTIDGDAPYWVNTPSDEKDSPTLLPDPERPGQMFFICECKNVSITDLHLKNGSYWHLFCHGCEDVMIRGLNINGQQYQYTNDGIDIDCCRRVTVSDCIINVGDDALTLRGYDKPLKDKKYCEDVVITNCSISSYGDYGLRIGVGSGLIRNCTISNLVIHDSNIGIGMMCRFSPKGSCTKIENIRISNVTIDAERALELRVSNDERHPPLPVSAYIRNILISGVIARSNVSSYLLGFDGAEFENVRISDSLFTFDGNGYHGDYPERGRWGRFSADSAFVLKKVRNVTFDGVGISYTDTDPEPVWLSDGDEQSVALKETESGWRFDVTAIDSENVKYRGCDFTKGTRNV